MRSFEIRAVKTQFLTSKAKRTSLLSTSVERGITTKLKHIDYRLRGND